ncbi:hypothetical protein EDB83DRAFT_2323097 [Lactarius deliciosus]|nr:hypothetical protein EDB83DRAFT_2323097 [Lactarius deliciosus]
MSNFDAPSRLPRSEVLWIVTLSHPLRRRLLTTLSRPPPTAVAESQWGEPRSDAFGTGVSVGEEEGGAGREWQACPSSGLGCGVTLYMLALSSSSSYPIVLVSGLEAPGALLHASSSADLRPPSSYRCCGVTEGCQVGEEEGRVGREWQAYSSSSPGRGAMVSVGVDSSSPGWRPLERCSMPLPLPTLGHPPPTAVAESQRGEPRLDAFGTGARVAGSISLWLVLLSLVGNCVGWRRGRWGRAGVAGLSFIGSWPWNDAPYARFVVVIEAAPFLPPLRSHSGVNRVRTISSCSVLLPLVGNLRTSEPLSDGVEQRNGGITCTLYIATKSLQKSKQFPSGFIYQISVFAKNYEKEVYCDMCSLYLYKFLKGHAWVLYIVYYKKSEVILPKMRLSESFAVRLVQNGITMDPDLHPAAANNGDALSYPACLNGLASSLVIGIQNVELSARYTWMPNIDSLDFVNDPVETGPYHNQDPQQIRRPNVGLYALTLAHKNQIYLEYENRLCGILDMLESLDATDGKESMEDQVLQELIRINRLKGLEWSGRRSKQGVNGATVNTESYFVTRHPQNPTLHAIYMTTLVICPACWHEEHFEESSVTLFLGE